MDEKRYESMDVKGIEGEISRMPREEMVVFLRRHPKFAELCHRFGEITAEEWIEILSHRGSYAQLASKCDKWLDFSMDKSLELLCRYSCLIDSFPVEFWKKLKGNEWTKLVEDDFHSFAEKLSRLAASGDLPRHWCEVMPKEVALKLMYFHQNLIAAYSRYDDFSVSDWIQIFYMFNKSPEMIHQCGKFNEFTVSDWSRILSRKCNVKLAEKCDKWAEFSPKDVCRILVAHPELKKFVPQDMWGRFSRVQWARMYECIGEMENDKEIKKKLIPDFCCPYHWVNMYSTLLIPLSTAAAYARIMSPVESSDVARLAEESVLNPAYRPSGNLVCARPPQDKYIGWLESVREDFIEAASTEDNDFIAEYYELVAKAAAYQIEKMRNECS